MSFSQEHIFYVSENQKIRLDHFLVQSIPSLSRSFLQQLIKSKQVSVRGEIITKAGYYLEPGDEVRICIPEVETSELTPEAIPLEILFQNEDLVVVNKPAGMVVHPSAGHTSQTLVNAVLFHCPDIQGIGGELRPGLVHRLDKETSGVIILAKNDQAMNQLQAQFKKRSVVKKYITLVNGTPQTKTGRIETYIGRDPKFRQKMAVVSASRGKKAISEYRMLEGFEEHSLLEVRIYTGRTHQIRVQLAHLGLPVVGDKVYGRKRESLDLQRQFLHAASLCLTLPNSKEEMCFEANLPEDLKTVLESLKAK